MDPAIVDTAARAFGRVGAGAYGQDRIWRVRPAGPRRGAPAKSRRIV